MHFIDTHAHLDLIGGKIPLNERIDSRADRDLFPVLNRAKQAGVTKIITVSSHFHEIKNTLAVAEKYENVWATVGVHSDDSANLTDENLAELESFIVKGAIRNAKEKSRGKKIVAIGEIGFDFGPHGTKQPANKQEDVFRKQLQLARKFKLPVIVHTRDADELTMKVLNDFTDVKLVVHCYQSGTDLTEMILKNPNWLFSFTGLITFQKRTEHILEVIKMVSIEKIMIETDAPFLAPVPYRGQINEPSFVAEVAKKIAMIKDLPLEKVAEQTTKNAEEFFGI